MAAVLNCLRSDVIVLAGDAGFHNDLLGEYSPDGSHGGKTRYRFRGGPYKGRDSIYLQWSAVDSAWMVRAPRDKKRNLKASPAWISCKPIIRAGPGLNGPHEVPQGNWVLADQDQRTAAEGLIVLKTRPGSVPDASATTAAQRPRSATREINYDTARMLCRYLGWAGAHQFYMGRPFHGFAMLQSLGFLGFGWVSDIALFDSLYVEPPPPPDVDKDSPEYRAWVEEHGQPPAPPTVVALPLQLRLEFHEMDALRALLQLAFAWVYEYAFRILFQYSMDTVMVVWAFKTIGACLAVWLIGSIGGIRASLVGMARVIAAIVAACVMLLRFPIWAPQFAMGARIGIVVIYFFTRSGRPRHMGNGYVFRQTSPSSPKRAAESKSAGDAATDEDQQLVRVARVAGNLKTTIVVAILAQVGFLLLAAISYMNNRMIMCAYREHLSLRELVFIAIKEHGLNIPKVVRLTKNLMTAWREDCWDGLYNYLDKPTEGDALYAKFTRPFEVLGLPPTATFKEVKKAYRDLARTHHPDKNKEEFSNDVFVQLQEAYGQLKKRFKAEPGDDPREL